MVYKIGFIGVPSSGKTTAARNLYQKIKNYGLEVELVTEFARDYMAQKGVPISSPTEQLHVQKEQLKREIESTNNSPAFLITDSPVLLGEIYLRHYYPKSIEHADASRLLSYVLPPYDILFHCPTRELTRDGIRFQTDKDLLGLEKQLKVVMTGLEYHAIPLPANYEERKSTLNDFAYKINNNWR